jgi:hypothetical protein
MNRLKAKIALLLLLIATISALPAQLLADGDPVPQGCGGMACPPPGAR